MTKIGKNLQITFFLLLFKSKIAVYLSLGLHKVFILKRQRPALQNLKFFHFRGSLKNFCPPGS